MEIPFREVSRSDAWCSHRAVAAMYVRRIQAPMSEFRLPTAPSFTSSRKLAIDNMNTRTMAKHHKACGKVAPGGGVRSDVQRSNCHIRRRHMSPPAGCGASTTSQRRRRFIGGRRAAAWSSTSTPDPRVHTCFHGVGLPPSTLKKGKQEATTDIPGDTTRRQVHPHAREGGWRGSVEVRYTRA